MSHQKISAIIQGKTYNEGDMLCSEGKDGKCVVAKILKIEVRSAGGYVFHQMLWDTFDHCPTVEEVKKQPPFIRHVPVGRSEASPLGQTTIIGNDPVTPADLDGYNAYEEAMQQ